MTNAALNILSIDGFRVLVVEAGGWRPEYLGVMVRECAAGLAVRPLDGDLGFLENLPSDLKYLVLMVNNPQGFRGIQRFSELEHLGLEFASRRSLSLAFDQAPALRSLSLTWNRGFAPLFEADLPQLNRLYISGQPYETLEPYQRFLQLRRFALPGNKAPFDRRAGPRHGIARDLPRT